MPGHAGAWWTLGFEAFGDLESVSANLTVSGPCVTVGAKFAAAAPHMKLYDDYANADVTASPTPTHPLPTP